MAEVLKLQLAKPKKSMMNDRISQGSRDVARSKESREATTTKAMGDLQATGKSMATTMFGKSLKGIGLLSGTAKEV